MPFEIFDRSRLKLLPLSQRIHDLNLDVMMDPEANPVFSHPSVTELAARIRRAKEKNAAVLLMLGGHVIRSGAAPLLIRLMEEGYITHFAMNGAAAIHDFEFAMIGATTESVAKYISEGQFGLWQEDGQYTQAISEGVKEGWAQGKLWENGLWSMISPIKSTACWRPAIKGRFRLPFISASAVILSMSSQMPTERLWVKLATGIS